MEEQTWRERLYEWLEKQHGTAGWQVKLENLMEGELAKAEARGADKAVQYIKDHCTNMKYVAIDYKSKHFFIADSDSVEEVDSVNSYIDVEKIIADDNLLTQYVEDCRYYGIPSYSGKDKELHERIKAIHAELDKYEMP